MLGHPPYFIVLTITPADFSYVGNRRDITLPRELFQILKTHFLSFH